jgi:hypothetical protein
MPVEPVPVRRPPGRNIGGRRRLAPARRGGGAAVTPHGGGDGGGGGEVDGHEVVDDRTNEGEHGGAGESGDHEAHGEGGSVGVDTHDLGPEGKVTREHSSSYPPSTPSHKRF